MSKTMPKQGEFCWNELMTTDVHKAKEFYKKLFGWEYQEHDVDGMKYTMIKAGEKEGGGMMNIPADQQGKIPPHWMSYVYVDDIDKSLTAAQSLGASVKVPATNAGDFGRFAVICDPTGAHLALWQSLKSC